MDCKTLDSLTETEWEDFGSKHCFEIKNMCLSCLKILTKDESQNIIISTPETRDVTNFTRRIFFPDFDEKFPNKMCRDCYNKVQEFYGFYELCQESTRKCLKILQMIRQGEEVNKIEVHSDDKGLELSDYDVDDDNESDGNLDFDPLITDNGGTCEGVEDGLNAKPSLRKRSIKQKSSEVFYCGKCDKRFFKEFRFKAHMRVHDGLKGYECPKCQKTFAKASTLSAHIRDIHEEPGSTYPCSYLGCDKVYARQQTLKWHHKSVHEKGESEEKTHSLIICEECGKTFKNMNSLKKHRYKHTGEELPFECEECHKRYITKHKLKEHMMRHAGIKNFVCPYCNMRKTTRHELKTHINYHTKEKQYSCNFCNYIGNSSGNLSRHVRIVHEGIKEYACRFCDRKFGKAETCKHHEMTHTGEKPHECGICGKRFIQAVALKTHMKTHNKTSKRLELSLTYTTDNPIGNTNLLH